MLFVYSQPMDSFHGHSVTERAYGVGFGAARLIRLGSQQRDCTNVAGSAKYVPLSLGTKLLDCNT